MNEQQIILSIAAVVIVVVGYVLMLTSKLNLKRYLILTLGLFLILISSVFLFFIKW